MTLEQLRLFVAVAEREHLTRAAEALNLTQSAASSAIAALEHRHDIALFDRIGRGLRLTEAGRRLLPEARAVLARAEAARQVLHDMADLTQGSLSIAASQTLASWWLPPMIVRFRRAHPGIALTLRAGNSREVVAEVAGHRADLGFIEGGEPVVALIDRPVGGDALHLVVAPGHPWAGATPNAGALAQGDWVMRERGSGTRAHMDAALAGLGVTQPDPAHLLELPTNEAVRQAVLAGGGASLLSHLVIGADLAEGRLIGLNLPPAPREFRLLRHPERHLSHAAQAFVKRLDSGV